MNAGKLNSTPVITCDHLFVLYFSSYCSCDSFKIKHKDFSSLPDILNLTYQSNVTCVCGLNTCKMIVI